MGRVPAKDGLDQAPFKALMELARLDNCWIKVCGAERIDFPPYDKAVPVAHAIIEGAADAHDVGHGLPTSQFDA